jgi:hypothetical protein
MNAGWQEWLADGLPTESGSQRTSDAATGR